MRRATRESASCDQSCSEWDKEHPTVILGELLHGVTQPPFGSSVSTAAALYLIKSAKVNKRRPWHVDHLGVVPKHHAVAELPVL